MRVFLLASLAACSGGPPPASDEQHRVETFSHSDGLAVSEREYLVTTGYAPPPEDAEDSLDSPSQQTRHDVQEARAEVKQVEDKLDTLLLRLEQAHPSEYNQVQVVRREQR